MTDGFTPYPTRRSERQELRELTGYYVDRDRYDVYVPAPLGSDYTTAVPQIGGPLRS